MGQLKLTPVEGLTYDDYAALPDDGVRRELINGDLYVVPAPDLYHQKLNLRLARRLAEQLDDTQEAAVFAAPCDVILSPHDTVQPDVVVVRRNRRGVMTKRAVEGAADLVIEIISPSTRSQDRLGKRALYERFRVPEYWLVDPEEKTVEVLVLTRGRYTRHAVFRGRSIARSQQFDAVEIRLIELFAPL